MVRYFVVDQVARFGNAVDQVVHIDKFVHTFTVFILNRAGQPRRRF
jgi:hypothetical protein